MDGHEKHDIKLADGAAMTRNYRERKTDDQVLGGYFSKDGLLKLLEQDECIGLRYYYALDAKGNQQLVLVGVANDENGNTNDMTDGLIADLSPTCPPYCSLANALNS